MIQKQDQTEIQKLTYQVTTNSMHIIAWTIIILNALNIFLYPLIIGHERQGKYSFTDWIAKLLGAALVVPVCLRVLGYI